MTWDLAVHIAGGTVGLVSGAVAIVAPKGRPTHRRAGQVFVGAMLVMAVTGGIIAALADVRVSVLAALLAGYLVASGWISGRRGGGQTGVLAWTVLVVGAATAALGGVLGAVALGGGRTDILDGGFPVPATMYFIFGGVAALGVATDVRTLLSGGLKGRARIQRHLWRMCVALLLGVTSFFSGQQDLFPKALRGSPLLDLPMLLVVGLMMFWLGRVALSRRYGPRTASQP